MSRTNPNSFSLNLLTIKKSIETKINRELTQAELNDITKAVIKINDDYGRLANSYSLSSKEDQSFLDNLCVLANEFMSPNFKTTYHTVMTILSQNNDDAGSKHKAFCKIINGLLALNIAFNACLPPKNALEITEEEELNERKMIYMQSQTAHESQIEFFYTKIKKNPSIANNFFNLGLRYENGSDAAQDVDMAKNYFQHALNIQPNDEHAIHELLRIEKLQQELETAKAWNNLGAKYFKGSDGRQKNFHLATACFEKALEKDPQCAAVLTNLALIYESGSGVTENTDKAKSYYEQALNIESDHEHAIQGLLRIENRQEKLETGKAWNNLGVKYFNGSHGRQKNCHVAKFCFEKAIEIEPECPARLNLDACKSQLSHAGQQGGSTAVTHPQSEKTAAFEIPNFFSTIFTVFSGKSGQKQATPAAKASALQPDTKF